VFAVSCKIDPEFIHRNHIGKNGRPSSDTTKEKARGTDKRIVAEE